MAKSKKNKKCYVLTIEYNTKEDQCEYIQEEIKEESLTTKVYKLGTIDLRDYFTESEIAGIINSKVAKT